MTFHWYQVPALLALPAYVLAAWPGPALQRAAGTALIAGWAAHLLAILFDLVGLGEPGTGARFGFAPALSATLWIVVAVYLIESRLVPLMRVRRVLAALGVVVVLLALAFPGERFQQHAAWAPLHWLLGIASYGLFATAVLHAGLLASADRQLRQHVPGQPPAVRSGPPLLRLERLTFQFVLAGFAALTATLIVGWWFTPDWRWDHKTVFSVLAWIVFAGLLAGRWSFGWRGRRATRWVYAGAALLLFGYVGSRFVLEVLLHRPIAS